MCMCVFNQGLGGAWRFVCDLVYLCLTAFTPHCTNMSTTSSRSLGDSAVPMLIFLLSMLGYLLNILGSRHMFVRQQSRMHPATLSAVLIPQIQWKLIKMMYKLPVLGLRFTKRSLQVQSICSCYQQIMRRG